MFHVNQANLRIGSDPEHVSRESCAEVSVRAIPAISAQMFADLISALTRIVYRTIRTLETGRHERCHGRTGCRQ